MKQRLINYTILIVIILGLTVFWINSTRANRMKIANSKIVSTTTPAPNNIVETVFHVNNVPIILNKDSITVGTEGGETTSAYLTITPKEYPILFQGWEQYDRFAVDGWIDSNKASFAIITHERAWRGGYAPLDFLIVELKDKRVVYKSPKEFGGGISNIGINKDTSEISLLWHPFYFNSGVTADMLPMLEFVRYNLSEKRFLLSNNEHKQAFKDLLTRFDSASESCSYYRKKMNADQIIAQYGTDKHCDSTIMSKINGFEDKNLLSVGDFDNIRINIKSILNGKNVSLLEKTPTTYPEPWGKDTCKGLDVNTLVKQSNENPIFKKYPDLLDYVKGQCQFLRNLKEFPTQKDTVLLFESYPGNCGSCGTREVDMYYEGLITTIDSGHEINFTIVKDTNDQETLEITYGILEPGDTNSNYKWTQVKHYRWDEKNSGFIKINENMRPSPYSK
jgi:hypothetical protein